MKKILIFILLSLIFTVVLEPSGTAKTGKHKSPGAKSVMLKHLEDLFFISQDLEENAAIMLKPEKGCFCSCRDSAWSCTDVRCGEHMKECRNPLPEQAESEPQSRSTFSWGG